MQEVGKDERVWVMRSLNWHGQQKALLALDICHGCNLEPPIIPIISDAIRLKTKRLYPIWTKCRESRVIEPFATSEHEHATIGFLESHPFQRNRLARAIRLFRAVSDRMYWRLTTGYI